MNNDSPRRTPKTIWANLALGVIFLLFAVGILHDAADGHLVVWDELFTAERARELTFQWPLTVRFNFEPTFRKPPLHYVVTAATSRAVRDPELGVRLWSGIYGAGCVILCAWWVRLLRPGQPWVGTVAAAWLSLNVLFFANSRIGLLDTGMTFYLLLTIIGCEKARTDSRWWFLAAAGIGLGFLQKLPLGAAYALIVVATSWSNPEFRRGLMSMPSAAAGALATLLVAWWPAIQTLKYGPRFLHGYFFSEMLQQRFQPGFPSTGRGLGFYFEHLWSSWGALGICAAAVCMLPLFRSAIRREPGIVAGAIFCISYLLITSVMITKYPRYLVSICPVLAGLLAAACGEIPKPKARWLAIALLTFAGIIPMARSLPPQRSQQAPEQLALAQSFGRELLPGETPVLIQPPNTGDLLLSFLLFYGKLDRPVIYVGLEQGKFWKSPLVADHKSTAFLGVAHRTHWPEVSRAFRNARILRESQRFIIFRADGTTGAPSLYRLTL